MSRTSTARQTLACRNATAWRHRAPPLALRRRHLVLQNRFEGLLRMNVLTYLKTMTRVDMPPMSVCSTLLLLMLMPQTSIS
jgi:hypothetical protein